jgi:hypothetical protein
LTVEENPQSALLAVVEISNKAVNPGLTYFPDLHFSEQYFTFSQSRAHFLRHSKGRLQR